MPCTPVLAKCVSCASARTWPGHAMPCHAMPCHAWVATRAPHAPHCPIFIISLPLLLPPACVCSECDLALDVFQQLLAEGCSPNLVRLVNCLIVVLGRSRSNNTHDGHTRTRATQRETQRQVQPCPFARPQPFAVSPLPAAPQVTFNILIDIHGKQGAWAKAVEVLDQLHAQGLTAEPRT